MGDDRHSGGSAGTSGTTGAEATAKPVHLRFFGTGRLDASRIAEEVLVHLTTPDCGEVRVILEIEAGSLVVPRIRSSAA